MADLKMIQVEVAYARPDVQCIIPVEVPEGATLGQALALSRISERFPEIDPGSVEVGVFGKLSELSVVLRPGDRVEIYRPLIADPKVIRKRRAAGGGRKKKSGDGEDTGAR